MISMDMCATTKKNTLFKQRIQKWFHDNLLAPIQQNYAKYAVYNMCAICKWYKDIRNLIRQQTCTGVDYLS